MFTVKRWHLVLFLLLFLTIGTPLSILEVEAAPLVWHIETVDAANNVGLYASLALDSADYPHISYHDLYLSDLKYARWTGSAWAIEPVDTIDVVGLGSSLSLDSSDDPHIAYHDAYSHLKYARWTGSSWAIEIVDNVPFSISSLALNYLDRPRISYCDPVLGHLKYARWTGSAWVIETVDTAGIVGYYSSLALGSDNYPRIAYYDTSNTNLKYARWTGSEWAIETVDTEGDVGVDVSLALDSADHPHIAYYDTSNTNLKYARWTGSEWAIETVDAANNVGTFASIALDSNNWPHISYYDLYWYDLKYAGWNGTGWFIGPVDHVNNVGYDPSLALDSSDHPHIAYYDATNANLKYASDPDEYIYTADITRFDVNGDGFNDSVEVELDVDTTHSGPLNVTVHGILTNGVGTTFDWSWSRWEITGYAVEYGYVTLGLPEEAPEGWYNVKLTLYDERGGMEDESQLNTVAYLYPPDMRELTIQVEGPGTTDPVPGSWWMASGSELGVTAIPDSGYVFAHWLLDNVDVGQENPFMVPMDTDHVLLAVFVEEVTPPAVIESCAFSGEQMDMFDLGETIYVYGNHYAPSSSFACYLVSDVPLWTNGMTLPARVPGTATTLTSNGEGAISPTDVWAVVTTPGHYDLVVDVNGNGQYDAGIDALDDNDIEVTAGWIIIPEFPPFLLLSLFGGGIGIAAFLRRRLT